MRPCLEELETILRQLCRLKNMIATDLMEISLMDDDNHELFHTYTRILTLLAKNILNVKDTINTIKTIE